MKRVIDQWTKAEFEELARQTFGDTEQTRQFCLDQERLYEAGVRDARLSDLCIFLIDRCGY